MSTTATQSNTSKSSKKFQNSTKTYWLTTHTQALWILITSQLTN